MTLRLSRAWLRGVLFTCGVVDGEFDPLSLHDAAGVETLEVSSGVAAIKLPRPELGHHGRLSNPGVSDHDDGGVVSRCDSDHVAGCPVWPLLRCCLLSHHSQSVRRPERLAGRPGHPQIFLHFSSLSGLQVRGEQPGQGAITTRWDLVRTANQTRHLVYAK